MFEIRFMERMSGKICSASCSVTWDFQSLDLGNIRLIFTEIKIVLIF